MCIFNPKLSQAVSQSSRSKNLTKYLLLNPIPVLEPNPGQVVLRNDGKIMEIFEKLNVNLVIQISQLVQSQNIDLGGEISPWLKCSTSQYLYF